MTIYDEPSSPRFDLYSVLSLGPEPRAFLIMTDLPWLVAEMLSTISHEKFIADMTRNGWAGSCPEWCGFKPVVVMPKGELIKIDQWKFLQEEAL